VGCKGTIQAPTITAPNPLYLIGSFHLYQPYALNGCLKVDLNLFLLCKPLLFTTKKDTSVFLALILDISI
jgi:hypothetical protein